MPIYLTFSFFSDSLSVLQSINNCKLDNPLVQDILLRFHYMSTKHIILCWLPSHTGIKGNEKADIAAKSALLLPPSNFKLPYTDFKPVINKYLFNKWQSVWDTSVHNKLHSIKPILSEWRPAYRMDRKEEVVLTRLKNWTFLCYSFIFAEGRGTAHVHPLRYSLHH